MLIQRNLLLEGEPLVLLPAADGRDELGDVVGGVGRGVQVKSWALRDVEPNGRGVFRTRVDRSRGGSRRGGVPICMVPDGEEAAASDLGL